MRKELKEKLEAKSVERRIVEEESAMIAKIESACVSGATGHCENSGYQLILIPHLTKATGACENFSTLFKTDLFGQTAYLNQTGQLMLEAFMERFEKTYCFGPSFRKEQKADERHLIEFPLFEIEVANCDLARLQTEICEIFNAMLEKVRKMCLQELEHIAGDLESLEILKPPYNAITYRDTLKELADYKLKFGDDLKPEHEQALVKMNNGRPLFITNYPEQIKFFNMRLNREDPSIVNSMDLILPYGGEAVGAAEREENYDVLKKRLEKSEMLKLLKRAIKYEEHECMFMSDEVIHDEAMSRFEWYMSIVKEKPIKHAGCGIGINRVMQTLLKCDDIRYSTAFPMNIETMF